MRQLTVAGAIAGFGLLVVAGCTITGDPDEQGVFQCDASTQCLDDQKCLPNSNGTLVCKEPDDQGTCVDKDGDGYGSSESSSLQQCEACENGARNGCSGSDECDQNANKHPGNYEQCDGIDNDCDGTNNEGIGVGTTEKGPCETEGDCPFGSSDLPYDYSMTEARWVCESVSGRSRCVVKGQFSGDTQCKGLSQDKQLGICKKVATDAGMEWRWTKVAPACRGESS